jgi:cytochrome c peroxidase
MRQSNPRRLTPAQLAAGGIGNCAACHPAPAFTDFQFHNTGAAQDEYDGVHGEGAFAALSIPDAATRNGDPDAYLPPSAEHPAASGRFRAVPSLDHPGFTDLGVWNIFANPAVPDRSQQRLLRKMICRSRRSQGGCGGTPEAVLVANAVGLFKTPGLRDLGHSGPYLHTGQTDTIEDIVQFYQASAARAREGTLRNGSRELTSMAITADDATALAAFLKSLNEDYE